MPLFTIKGHPDRPTFLFESNPDPERYERVEPKKSAPKPKTSETPTTTKES